MVNAPGKKFSGGRLGVNRFCKEDGYALTLALIALPLIMGFAVLVLDASRITNLHTDLQNAVDAMAISGARELDGRNDAIDRAKLAVQELEFNEAWFGEGGAGLKFGTKIDVKYVIGDDAASTVKLEFLKSIPASDDTYLSEAVLSTHRAATPNEARYLLVRAKPQSLTTMFPLPISGREEVDIATEAVAVYTAAACDVTPIYICNPFEGDGSGKTFNEHFEDGSLYGKEVVFQNTGAASTLPGNFGFLRTYGNGANVLAEALATGSPGVCYSSRGVDTEPGANVGPVEQGINTRMGLYSGSYKGAASGSVYRPDKNARIGQKMSGKVQDDCGDYNPEADPGLAMGLPHGEGGTLLTSGGQVTDPINATQFNLYWDISHNDELLESPYEENADGNYVLKEDYVIKDYSAIMSAIRDAGHHNPNPVGDFVPSRYDIYKYEVETEGMLADASLNDETGDKSMCHTSGTTLAERRRIFSAIVNCQENEDLLQGAATGVPVEAFAMMFLTRPAISDGSNKQFRLEFTDITGKGGLGEVEDFFREESVLVR